MMLALLVLGQLFQEQSLVAFHVPHTVQIQEGEAGTKKLKGKTFLIDGVVLNRLSNVTKHERTLICLRTKKFCNNSTVKTKQIRKFLEFPSLYNCFQFHLCPIASHWCGTANSYQPGNADIKVLRNVVSHNHWQRDILMEGVLTPWTLANSINQCFVFFADNHIFPQTQ